VAIRTKAPTEANIALVRKSGQARRPLVQQLFPPTHALLPQINQIYELELAYGEYGQLSDDELVQRGAYFKSVNGVDTHHYRICISTPDQVNASASQDRKNFFLANVFAVGYATHGLFPYRGKFHPQMIKAVMNIMGLQPGNTVLDPMAGCGTTAIEANIMGINAITCDLNPFTCLMTRAKVGVLTMDCSQFPNILRKSDRIYESFAPVERQFSRQETIFGSQPEDTFDLEEAFPQLSPSLRELLLLCFFDSVGYAARRARKTARDLFPDLLERYLAAVKAFNEVREELTLPLGKTQVLEGDARELKMPPERVDGVLFSPPYSFAIDYVENDRPQLELLKVNVNRLKENMVGLTGAGKTREELLHSRVHNYFQDMQKIMVQCKGILRSGGYCVIVIGSNTNQTGGISLESGLIEIGRRIGMPVEFQLSREIEGIRNTMRDEHLLFFRKLAP